MLKAFLFLLCLGGLLVSLLPANEPGEEQAQWLQVQAIPIRTIDPGDDDFTDLMPLKDCIGTARVVGLSDPSHGDGATFKAKTRLIRFLHQEMGFDLIVWESGLLDCKDNQVQGIFPMWTQSKQLQPLFDYLSETQGTDRPLEVAGMDCQFLSYDGVLKIRDRIKELLGRVDPPPVPLETQTAFLEGIDALANNQVAGESLSAFQEAAGMILEWLDSECEVADLELSFLDRAIKNLVAGMEVIYHYGRAAESDNPRQAQIQGALVRETEMADTLLWYARECYPDRKILVWAAAGHLTYQSRKMEMRDSEGGWAFDTGPFEPLGNAVKQALKEDYYVIHFIADHGTHGNIYATKPLELPAAEPDTLDGLCHATGLPYLYLDFKTLAAKEGGAWLKESLVARPRRYQPMRAVWNEVCDAFFFTDEMFPSEPRE